MVLNSEQLTRHRELAVSLEQEAEWEEGSEKGEGVAHAPSWGWIP